MSSHRLRASVAGARAQRRRLWAPAAGAVALALVLTACGGGDTGGDTAPEPNGGNGGPVAGGEISQITSVDISSFDPARLPNMNPTLGVSALSLVYGQLLWADTETGEVSPGIAESMTVNDDGTVWTLKLREGVEFTDGTPYDAEAVKFNWDRLADEETAAVNGAAARSFESTVVDPLTLELHTEKPNFLLDRVVAAQLTFIASPTAIEGNPDVFTTDPVGAGPFDLTEAVSGSHYVYTRNDGYWEEGKPYLDKVTLRVVADRQQQFDTVATGGADLFIGNSMEAREILASADLTIPDIQVGGGRMMFFNTTRAPFDDPRARHALALALDAEELAFTQEPGADSAHVTNLFAPNSPYYDESLTIPGQDIDEAQRLFDELAAEGKPVEFSLVAGGAGGTRAAELLQAKMTEFDNVTVNLDIIPLPNYEEQVAFRGDFDLTFRPGNMFVNSPAPGIDQLLRTGGVSNHSRYSSAEMDALLDAVLAEPDVEGQREALAQVHELFLEDMPFFPYGNSNLIIAHIPRLAGIQPYEEGSLLYQELYLEQ
ncbi:ABC transporter substrate-binding protein [Microbacterium album]|uniref:ABC transporter substrate-binding protein n=1 Tax=Microbacterium album TaxID=2053191 RepID=A0A917ID45_9MICO|nr:ABC transporter substrate-binding protein [Microbacterium album]GGH41048.1 ABC transporter substrate-binding protein [Microbacterium album]